jgi:hypothetical protein
MLENKDADYSKYIPAAYKVTQQEKEQKIADEGLVNRYTMERSTNCMKQCFKNLDSPVVSISEANCMTNCTTKALECLSTMRLLHH